MNNQDIVNKLALLVKNLRKRAGLSQHGLADHASVGKTVIFDIEHAKPTVKLITLLKVLNVLNIEIQIKSPLDEYHEKS